MYWLVIAIIIGLAAWLTYSHWKANSPISLDDYMSTVFGKPKT
jgi:uncharacterized membrane protein YedE/YeeE